MQRRESTLWLSTLQACFGHAIPRSTLREAVVALCIQRMLRFGDFELDRDARQLRRGGRALHLTPKALDLLQVLIDHRPKAVPKSAIRDRLWPGTFVSESTLTSLVSELRTVLDDHARAPRFLRTVHGVGYAFCGEAEGESPAPPPGRGQAWFFVVQAGRDIRLSDGENVLGREPDAAVQLESNSVSRTHAVIRVGPAGASIADRGSRNGTSVNGRPVRGEVPLGDGDRIRVGDEELRFKVVERSDLGETRPGAAGRGA
jgi:DNA-binding winged helix-turn-helix (wHTH) protein